MNQQTSPQAQQLLDQLEPIVTPPPVGWWPLAPGWWILIVVVLAAIAGLASWAVIRHKRQQYRRDALAALRFSEPQQSAQYIETINNILKRTALCAYPAATESISQKYGEQWVELLNNLNPRHPLSSDAAHALSQAIYQANPEFDPQQLQQQATRWVKTHPKKSSRLAHV